MSTPSLKERITDAMKDAMRARDKERLGTVRLMLAAFKQIEVDERIELDEQRSLAVLDKMLKQRKDSFTQFSAAGRMDLADKESAEMVVIQSFMPTGLTEDELSELIEAAITEAGASTAQDMGKVMNLLKPRIQGRADMGSTSQRVRQRLSQ